MIEAGVVLGAVAVAAILIWFGFIMGRRTYIPPVAPQPRQYNPGAPALADQDPFAMAMEPGSKEGIVT